MTTHTLEFPVPHEPRSINKMPRSRGGAIGLGRERSAWRDTAEAYAADMDTDGDTLPLVGPREVQVTIPFSTNRRRDPHNYTGTVVKWVVDGLVRAGVFADDDSRYVRVADPELVVGDTVKVTIRRYDT